MKAEDLAGKACPYCLRPFIRNEKIVVCSACGLASHLLCWQKKGGCPTPDCGGFINEFLEGVALPVPPVSSEAPLQPMPAAPVMPEPAPEFTLPRESKPIPQKTGKAKPAAVILALAGAALVIVAAAVLLTSFVFIPAGLYSNAGSLFADGRYDEAYEIYSGLGGFRDSADKAAECIYMKADAAFQKGSYDEAKELFKLAGSFSDSETMVKKCDHQKAVKLQADGEYAKAKAIFKELAGFLDSDDRARDCDYMQASGLLSGAEGDTAKLDEAKALFVSLGDYRDAGDLARECDLKKADILIQNERFGEAYDILNPLAGLASADERLNTVANALLSRILASGNLEDPENSSFFYEKVRVLPDNRDYLTELTRYISARDSLSYWHQNPDSKKIAALVSKYEGDDAAARALVKVLEAVAENDFLGLQGWMKDGENRDAVKELWDFKFIRELVTDDTVFGAYLVGFWTDTTGAHSLEVTDLGDDAFGFDISLPLDIPPETTSLELTDMSLYCKNGNVTLSRAFTFEIDKPDEISVYCAADGNTYTFTR